jgi:hypothetical protein
MSPTEIFMQSFGVSGPSVRGLDDVAAGARELARLEAPMTCTSLLRDRFADNVKSSLPKSGTGVGYV